MYKLAGRYWCVRARGEPFDRGPRRNVLVERVVPWMGLGWGDQWFRDIDGRWWRPARHPLDGQALVVRPFRGLRRA